MKTHQQGGSIYFLLQADGCGRRPRNIFLPGCKGATNHVNTFHLTLLISVAYVQYQVTCHEDGCCENDPLECVIDLIYLVEIMRWSTRNHCIHTCDLPPHSSAHRRDVCPVSIPRLSGGPGTDFAVNPSGGIVHDLLCRGLAKPSGSTMHLVALCLLGSR